MAKPIERDVQQIVGVLSCFDRLVLQVGCALPW
jgi:hypothetical protein